MEPHSLLFGHLKVMKGLGEGLPKDAHTSYATLRIARDWKRYFPTATKCPPVIYLDLWPFFSQPIIMLFAPEPCYQAIQESPQPRHPMFKWSLTPLTDGKDLISMACSDMASHRMWRSRLNPGFSPRNLISNMPALLDEVGTFARLLKDRSGRDGDWGDMFTLYDKAMNLTLDVICRVGLDLHPHEQTRAPGPLSQAMENLTRFAKFNNLWNRIERLTPAYRRAVSTNAKVLRDALSQQIEKRYVAAVDAKEPKTIVDLAIKEMQNETGRNESGKLSSQFTDIVISQLKLFLFAGHDTTGQTICWILYEINKYPLVLEGLRAEHDKVLGSDPELAAEVLRREPHKINELQYTSAVIKETLRLHNLGASFRQGSPNFNFVIDGTVYPTADCMMQTVPTTIHVRKDLWPRPMEFLPERFLVPEGHPLHPLKNAWRAFEMGSMRCIGEELAMMEMRLVLVFTTRSLEFKFDWAGWDTAQGRMGPPDTVLGERGYRCGSGVGSIKDALPTRVRIRV